MPLKVISQRDWKKGIVAVSNRFSVPKGALPLLVNLLLNERGALQVCDGSTLISGIPTPPGPILAIGSYVDSSGNITRVGVIQKNATTINLYNLNANPATQLAGTGDITITNGWTHPQIFQFAGNLIITLGNGQVPVAIPSIGSSPAALTSSTVWKANHQYFYGDTITNTAGTLLLLCYGINNGFTGAGAVAGVSAPGTPAGISGALEPTWNTNIGGGTFDAALLWQTIGNTALGALGRAAGQVPVGAAHVISHAGALWAWNTKPTDSTDGLDGPSVIRQSAINNINSWPVVNVDYVGKDDGTTGTGIATFTIAEAGIAPTASLVLFKDFTTYQVTGLFQTSNFQVQQVKSDMGCVAPRTPQFATGYGIFRLSHLGVSLFDGVSDTLISEEVRPYIFGGFGISGMDFANQANAYSVLCTNPPMYMLAIPLPMGVSNYYGLAGGDGALIRVLCYDLIMKAWAVIDLPFKISAMFQLRVPGATPQTQVGGFADGKVRSLQSGATTFDTGPDSTPEPINWKLTTPTIGEPTSRNYYRRLQVRMHAPSSLDLTIAPTFDAQAPPSITPATQAAGPSASQLYGTNVIAVGMYEGDNDYVMQTDLGQTAETARADISGSGKATIEGVDWHVVPKPPRAAGVAA